MSLSHSIEVPDDTQINEHTWYPKIKVLSKGNLYAYIFDTIFTSAIQWMSAEILERYSMSTRQRVYFAVATKEFLGNMTETAFLQLKYALDAGQIIPYFQPLTNLLTGEVYGFEVLSRWHHPTHGILMPDDFIPLAEAGDLIGDLTENVGTAAAR